MLDAVPDLLPENTLANKHIFQRRYQQVGQLQGLSM
jgi:hypothetical protein